jgi:GTP 3',8-cyclase
MSTNEKKQKLENEIRKNKLLPNPLKVGEFVKTAKDLAADQMKFLSPNSWVFHDNVVAKVLEGDYLGMTPYSGELVTTMNCTNRCVAPCSYDTQRLIEGIQFQNKFKNSRVHMQSLDFATSLVDKLIEGGLKGLIFTGGGEPFLFNKLPELVKYTTDHGLDAVVYSNGNAISERKAKQVIEASPKLVRISLNAGTKEVYNLFHNPSNPDLAFQRALSSIKYFAKGSLENPEMEFGVSFIFNNINSDDMPATADRLKEIVEEVGGGIKFVAYRPSFCYHSGRQLKQDVLDQTYAVIEDKVRPILEGVGVKVSNVACRYDALKNEDRGYDKCLASGLFTEISPLGEAHICCDRNCHRAYSIGSLVENSLHELFSGENRIRLLDYINTPDCDRNCPPACKPHEVNKQFSDIEKLRSVGEMYKVELWIDMQREMPIPKMVNF